MSLVVKMKERELPRIIPPQMERPPYSLSGADLLVYADLWKYSREKPFIRSYQYLADWINLPKTTLMRSVKCLVERGLVEIVAINAHKTSFQAKAIPEAPLPVYNFNLAGYTDSNEPLRALKEHLIDPEGLGMVPQKYPIDHNRRIMIQNGPLSDQNGPIQYNLNNTNYKNKTYNKEKLNNNIDQLEYARRIEAQMREENHRLRDLHDLEASKPEAIEAGEAFFKKFCKGS